MKSHVGRKTWFRYYYSGWLALFFIFFLLNAIEGQVWWVIFWAIALAFMALVPRITPKAWKKWWGTDGVPHVQSRDIKDEGNAR